MWVTGRGGGHIWGRGPGGHMGRGMGMVYGLVGEGHMGWAIGGGEESVGGYMGQGGGREGDRFWVFERGQMGGGGRGVRGVGIAWSWGGGWGWGRAYGVGGRGKGKPVALPVI